VGEPWSPSWRSPRTHLVTPASFLGGVPLARRCRPGWCPLIGTGTLAVLGLAPGFAGMPLRDLLRTRNVPLLGMAALVRIAFAVTGLVDWTLVALLVVPAAAGWAPS
jgi:hypothetical protein